MKKYDSQYYINREIYNKEKHFCDCGGQYTISHKQRHFKSLKHQNFINQV